MQTLTLIRRVSDSPVPKEFPTSTPTASDGSFPCIPVAAAIDLGSRMTKRKESTFTYLLPADVIRTPRRAQNLAARLRVLEAKNVAHQ